MDIYIYILQPKSINFGTPDFAKKKKSHKILKEMCNIHDEMVKTCVMKIM
jgi:hypothetical protein